MNSNLKLLPAALLVAVLAVAGCGGGGDDTPPPTVTPEATAFEAALDMINSAETEAAAQAAYDAVDMTAITAEEGAQLMTALDDRIGALQLAARIMDQKMALANAAMAVDTSDLSTTDAIAAAENAIAGLESALEMATDVSDADKAMYQTQLNNANGAVQMAQEDLDTQGRMDTQRMRITSAVNAARAAVMDVNDESSEADVMAADRAMTALMSAIEGAEDLPEGDPLVASAQGTHATLAGTLASAKMSRTTAMDKARDNEIAAMAATAAKLYAGISAPMGTAATHVAGDRFAAYDSADTAIEVWIGDGENVPTAASATLTEDKKTMIADNHGWKGKRYTASPAGGGTYEAVVYSNVDDPTPGKKFGKLGASGQPAAEGYQYVLTDTHGGYTLPAAADASAANAPKVRLDISRTSGTETWGPDRVTQRPQGDQTIDVDGTFHGVTGTYYCITNTNLPCAAKAVGDGFDLTGGQNGWWFVPTNPEARVMDEPDTVYASYGWWLHKAANDGAFIASAFVDERGAVLPAAALNALGGTATYEGGAAGKYALSSTTGGTNDAGHFTARATLEANFDTNTDADTTTNAITGIIDMFTGADGESRDWEVRLQGSPIGDTGVIGTATGAADGARSMTVWKINGKDADESDNWIGTLRGTGTTTFVGDGGVPEIATGTFYSEYGSAGRMVGGFGATTDQSAQ